MKKNIGSYLLLLFSIVVLLMKMVCDSEILVNVSISAGGLLCLSWSLFRYNNYRNLIIRIGFTFSALLLLNNLFIGNSELQHLLWIWGYLGVASLLHCNGLSLFHAKIVVMSYTLFFIHKAIMGDVVISSSGLNIISSIYIYAIAIYCITKYKLAPNTLMPYSPLLILAFLSIWAGNRGGVLCAFVMTLLIVCYNMLFAKISKFKSAILFVIFIYAIAYFYVNLYDNYSALFIEKYDRYGNESSRTVIWMQYIDACFENIIYLLFGVSADDSNVTLFHLYAGNAHNGIFMCHSKLGLMGLLIIVSASLRFIKTTFKNHDFPLLIVFLVILLRSMFDWTCFWGLYDIFFYYIMFYLNDKEIQHKLRPTYK